MKLLSTFTFLFVGAIFCFNPAFSSNNSKNAVFKGPNGEEIKNRQPKIYVDPAIHFAKTRVVAMDTLFWDDFDGDTVINIQTGFWISYDLDGGNPSNGGLPTDYFIWEDQPVYDMNNGDTLYLTNVAVSYSWLTPTDSNFNDLVTGYGIPITKSGSILKYISYPQQGPQWMDGYNLKIDAVNGDPYAPTADTLVFHKQYVSGDGPLWDPSLVFWPSTGDTIFGEFYYDSTMASKADSGNAVVGPTYYEFSLDAYVGQTIYIHLFHDAYDDVAIWFDDFGVFEPITVGLEKREDFHLKAYPNPASDFLNIEFSAVNGEYAKMFLVNTNGKIVKSNERAVLDFGMSQEIMDVSDLPSGIYMLKMEIGEKSNTTKVIIH
jgi:Secretion system C-terminal sorting domain